MVQNVKIPKPQGVSLQLLKYALPSVVGMLIVGFQTIIDGLFVSVGVGALGLAAVNLSMPLINVLLAVSIMIISGGIVITGVAQGRGDEPLVKGYTALTFVVLLATIFLLSFLVWANLDWLCLFLGADDNVLPYVRNYLGIIGSGFIFYCIPNFTEAFTRLRGRPNMVFVSGTICCLVNVVLDYVFVLRLGWGVSGAAIATCAANTTAALVLAPMVRMGRIRGSLREVWRIFYNGSSELFTSISAAVTTFIFNLVLMRVAGYTGVAALTIVCYLNFIVNMSIFGLSQALYPLMSYQLGARNFPGIRSLLKWSLLFSACIGWGVYLLVFCFRGGIVSAFTEGDAALMLTTRTAVTWVTLHYLISFVNIIASSFHTAVERPIESAVIAVCRSIVFVLIPLFLLVPSVGIMGVWLSMPIAELLTLGVSLPLMRRTLRRLAE
ncbi:MAG: polysaccharide biosynthesis C-terminal domain-containing protein [Bacteroidales bacterium]|nr:polysaccharide biosynthesis C-terminal domain-containing protein [Bacteroidales bacterium]